MITFTNLQIIIAVGGWVVSLVVTSLIVGRWTSKVESGGTIELKLMNVRLEHVVGQLAELKAGLGVQYTDVVQQVRADHGLMREVLDWRAAATVQIAVLNSQVTSLVARNDRRGLGIPQEA